MWTLTRNAYLCPILCYICNPVERESRSDQYVCFLVGESLFPYPLVLINLFIRIRFNLLYPTVEEW